MSQYIMRQALGATPTSTGIGLIDWMTGAASPDASAPEVNQTASGTGSIATSDFRSIGGVCKPTNFPALNFVRELQRQMNRVAHVKKFGKIGPDGEIGPGTLALFRKVQALDPTNIMGDASSCILIAGDSDVIGEQVRTLADSLGAPATVSGPVQGTNVASIVHPTTGKTIKAPGSGAGLMGAWSAMGSTEKVVMVGLLGGIGYVLYTKHQKKGG